MPAGGNVNGIIPYPTTVSVLDNGLKLIVMPMPSNGLLGFWSVVRTGSRDEFEPGRSGFAHFFEHMMFRGTERFPNEVYQRILTEIGADGNAYTTDDLTAYHLGVTGDDLERVMELESDRFQNLFYSEHDFKTEAGAVYGEYRKSKTEPLFVLYEAVRAAAFEQHPYGHTTLGYERDIAIMPTLYEFSQSFLRRYYRPENTVLLLTGNVEPARAEALAARYYGGWQPGYARRPFLHGLTLSTATKRGKPWEWMSATAAEPVLEAEAAGQPRWAAGIFFRRISRNPPAPSTDERVEAAKTAERRPCRHCRSPRTETRRRRPVSAMR